MNITCGHCGHEGSVRSFCETKVFGDLPDNFIQCPNCNLAFVRIVREEKAFLEPETPFLIPMVSVCSGGSVVRVKRANKKGNRGAIGL